MSEDTVLHGSEGDARRWIGAASSLLVSPAPACGSMRLRTDAEPGHVLEPECSVTSTNRSRNRQTKPYTWCNGLCDWYVSATVSYHQGRHRYRYPVHNGSLYDRKECHRLIVYCAHDRNVRHHVCRFAVCNLFSIGITGVGHYLEAIHLKCLLSSLSHRLQATDIRCVEGHCVCHDQCVFRIDGSLDVVRRKGGLTHKHIASVRFRMLLQLFERSLYRSRINVYLLFFVGFLDTIKVTSQSKSVANAIDASHSAKLRAIDCDPLTSDESTAACKADKLCPSRRDCIAVHPTEFSDTLMAWIQASYKPHQLDVSAALSFQAPRRADLVQIAV